MALSVLFFPLNSHSLCLEKTPHGFSLLCLRLTQQSETPQSPLSCGFPVSLFLLLTPLRFNMQVQQKKKQKNTLCFVLGISRSGKKGGGLASCVLIFWLAVMLWVLRGLKHITKLICPLHRRPCPRSVLRLPPSLHFSTDVFGIRERRWEATRHHSGEISSACRPLIFWLQELCAARLWWKKLLIWGVWKEVCCR